MRLKKALNRVELFFPSTCACYFMWEYCMVIHVLWCSQVVLCYKPVVISPAI